jgi:hypothetical protein
MRKTDPSLHCRVFYRPIEAAIRWSGLLRFETRILDAMNGKGVPDLDDFPRWPMLRLNTERIFDALRNGELPYGKSGVTSNDSSFLDDPDITVRHVDLKAWMARFYPDQKPTFLFDEIERQLHSAIGIDAVQALLADRVALKARLAEKERSFDVLHERHRVLCKRIESLSVAEHEVSPRSEGTYLNIVGGLLGLLLGQVAERQVPYSSFETLESVISSPARALRRAVPASASAPYGPSSLRQGATLEDTPH